MKRKIKLFEVQTDLKSYAYLVVKMISCLIVYILIFKRDWFIHVSSPWMDTIVTILSCALVIATIRCLYVSIAELMFIAEDKKKSKKAKKRPKKTKTFSVDAIVKMAEENDILEIELVRAGKLITVGASSDCKRSSGVFFDKRYYIEETEYETPALFKEALTGLFPQGSCAVCTIDGIPPE